MELLFRLERAFRVPLPEQVLATAEALRDLVEAVHKASCRNNAAPSHGPWGLGVSRSCGRDTPGQQPWSRYWIGTPVYTLNAEHGALYVEDEHVERRSPMLACMPAAAVGAERYGARPPARTNGGAHAPQPVATFSQVFMAFCWLGGFLSLSILRPASHSLRSACAVRCAFSAMRRRCSLWPVPEAKPLARLLSAQVEGLDRVVTVSELMA